MSYTREERMRGLNLAKLIEEHAEYCMYKYQPIDLPHLTMNEALDFQSRMTQSLTHFGIWLESVKYKEVK